MKKNTSKNTNPTAQIAASYYDAVIFDLDGVITKTAKIHVAAWKTLFDEYLEKKKRGDRFDINSDYKRYVDGKPRYEGVKSFLASRNIDVPYGSPDDSPEKETICGLGNKKNVYFHEFLEKEGVQSYEGAADFIHRLREAKIKTAVVSSSKNCVPVLEAAHMMQLFHAKVDGLDAERLSLTGKPAPDIFLKAAEKLHVPPSRAVVVEDAIAGVKAGKWGQFGCVIGVDRTGQKEVLKENGADMVVTDLSEIIVIRNLPSALEAVEEIMQQASNRRMVLFLDYDGTLTPIVSRPEEAVLSDAMRDILRELAGRYTVAVISGRDLADVKNHVGIENIFYAGSHGFDIAGPEGRHIEVQQGKAFLPTLDKAQEALEERLGAIPGAAVERKKFSIAAHYRNVEAGREKDVAKAVDEVHADYPSLRKSSGKKIYELQPRVDWHKGKAVQWLLETLGLDQPDVLPIYIGDDITDEDAFAALSDRGIGIVARDKPRPTAAQYELKDPGEVKEFLRRIKE